MLYERFLETAPHLFQIILGRAIPYALLTVITKIHVFQAPRCCILFSTLIILDINAFHVPAALALLVGEVFGLEGAVRQACVRTSVHFVDAGYCRLSALVVEEGFALFQMVLNVLRDVGAAFI